MMKFFAIFGLLLALIGGVFFSPPVIGQEQEKVKKVVFKGSAEQIEARLTNHVFRCDPKRENTITFTGEKVSLKREKRDGQKVGTFNVKDQTFTFHKSPSNTNPGDFTGEGKVEGDTLIGTYTETVRSGSWCKYKVEATRVTNE